MTAARGAHDDFGGYVVGHSRLMAQAVREHREAARAR